MNESSRSNARRQAAISQAGYNTAKHRQQHNVPHTVPAAAAAAATRISKDTGRRERCIDRARSLLLPALPIAANDI
jgi:hypothetical protein